MAGFREWLSRFEGAAAAGAVPAALVEEGRTLAAARKPAMMQLMRENPYRALEQSVKWREWTSLPPEVRALVEEPFSESATLSVIPDCRDVNARKTPWQTHSVSMRGDHFAAYVYGHREDMSTKAGTPLQGILLERQIALWESPALVLEGSDLAAAQGVLPDGNDRTRSWITGDVINGAGVAALIGGKIHYFADAGELQQVTSVVTEAEAQPGPHGVAQAWGLVVVPGGTFSPVKFAKEASRAKSIWTETMKRLLIMRVDFTPNTAHPYAASNTIINEFLGASNVFREMSFGKTWQSNTVVPQMFYTPQPQSYWETNSTGADGLMGFAQAQAAALGYNTNNYDIFVVSMPYMLRYDGAAAFAGGPHMWINGGPWGAGVPVHELGHNYGYIHANYWRGNTGAGFLGHTNGTGGVLEHEEYGDPFDIMGDAYTAYPNGHFSMQAKSHLNWIETNEVINVTTSGVYRVRRFDHINARLLAGTKLALQITNGTGDRLWVGYRRAHTLAEFSQLNTGAYIIWGNEVNAHRLIDTTRLSAPNGNARTEKLDSPLQPGRAYVDPSGTVRITVLTSGGASPNEYLDIDVQLLTSSPPYELFTTSNRTTRGLVGSYVNTSLRSRLAQEDWRVTGGVTVSGTRTDTTIVFRSNGWGLRGPVGVTGGSDADWENFSVQWDGWVQVNRATKFATVTDDGSRMWIDLDGNGAYGSTAPELINNNWGTGQGPTRGEISVTVPPGLYRMRIHYEEGVGGNYCELVGSAVEFDIYTDAALTTNGLTGSYVNASLRSYSPQDDWRTTQTISGRRRDAFPLFLDNAFAESLWGNRTNVGITGGSNADWDNYSVQWDGWIRIYTPMRFATFSDDSSRMWIDVDNNGTFGTTGPEYINNHWGTSQGATYGDTSAIVPPGTYRVRIQYEEGNSQNHFALYGSPQDTPGLAGYAGYFDGVNDYMEVPNAAASFPTDEITIEFWQRVYEQRNQSTFSLVPDNIANRVSAHVPWSDGAIYWDFGSISTGGRLSYVPPVSPVGTWQHFALVSSRAGNFQRIYRNGVPEASDATSLSFVRFAAALRLGISAANEAMKGELDEFRIWAVARTDAEIQQNMTCRLPVPQANLWAYWRFDEGTGTTVADLSGNGRNGTMVNGAGWMVSTIPGLSTRFTNVVTTLADSGPGSLRSAITNVNACDCSSVITFALNGAVNLASPLPTITSSVEIIGRGTNQLTISGNNATEIFTFAPGTTNRITLMTLARGFSANAGSALRNGGHLTLQNVVLSSNQTTHSFGGAVCNFPGSSFSASNCHFVGNVIRGGDGESRSEASTSGGAGGGGAGMGGAIFHEGGGLNLTNCTFTRNIAMGGNGGNGGGNISGGPAGGNGGFPNRGTGGAASSVAGGSGGFGGGGGGGGTFAAGGMGGYGGGGGGGGSSPGGGTGGAGAAGGPYGGSGGTAQFSFAGGGGGGAGLGGAIFARTGEVSLVNCTFVNNLATNGLGGYGSFGAGNGANGQGIGGGLYVLDAKVTKTNLTFTGNIATTADPNFGAELLVTSLADAGSGSLRQAICNAAALPGDNTVTFAPNLSGGVITLTSDSLVISNQDGAVTVTATNLPNGLTLNGNNARQVVIVRPGESLVLDSLTISNGQAISYDSFTPLGGGLFNYNGTAVVRRCTFVDNDANFGGAIMSYLGKLTVEHCTLSRNVAGTGGGAIETGSGVPDITLRHCTIMSNAAPNGGGIRFNNGLVNMSHTLVAGNGGGDVVVLSATYSSNSYNVVRNGTSSGLTDGANGNRIGTGANPLEARVGALRRNGGPTLTHMPLGGSPVVDAGDLLFNGFGLKDQRGVARVANSRIDVGAVETSLRLYYDFDNFTATDAAGSSIAEYQGVPLNIWWNSDHRGQVASANALNDPGFGTNNYFRLITPEDPTNSNRGLGLKGDFTVSVWILARQSNAWNVILGNTGPGGPGTLVFGLSQMRPYFAFWGNDLFTESRLPLNTWTHLAYSYDSHGGLMSIYVNGALVASAMNRVNTTKDANVLLGYSEAIVDSHFRGFIDEFAIFGEALSPSQISALAAPAGIFANATLPEPVLSPGLAAAECGWNVREIYAHLGNPVPMPDSLPSAEHVANTPQFGQMTNYNSAVIARYDPDINMAGGHVGTKVPFASDDRTPQGLINGDDNYFVIAAAMTLRIEAEDDYTFGFSTDDGARLRIKGAIFTNSISLFGGNPAVPAHRGDVLAFPDNTGDSLTLGVTHLKPGNYEVEFISWELGGGAVAEVFAARGAKTGLDSTFELLSPLLFTAARPSVSVSRVPLSPNVQLSWSDDACYRLQSASNIMGPWTYVPNGTNGVVVTPSAAATFYRLSE